MASMCARAAGRAWRCSDRSLASPRVAFREPRGTGGKGEEASGTKRGRVVARRVLSNEREGKEGGLEALELSSKPWLDSWEDTVCLLDGAEGCHELRRTFERDDGEREFLQAVRESMRSLAPLFETQPGLYDTFLRLLEPERVVIFRVPWVDDRGRTHVNRGYRVQFSSALGPYKGGLRFHPTVTLSVLKFLAFEQCFKNALTGLPLGAGKGGADFDPKGKSDGEVMRFCQSFMTELHKHIGPAVDVPAGDIGVGAREVGYLYGQYKRLTGRFEGAMTGKGLEYGGSHIRPEATGYGLVYFLNEMVTHKGIAPSLQGLKCAISGSGNVASFAAEKLLRFGATPMTMSDSGGTILAEGGLTAEHLEAIRELKEVRRGRLSDLKGVQGLQYFPGCNPWALGSFDVALPCATQNELGPEDAIALAAGGCLAVAEGANMPTTPAAARVLEQAGVAFGPAKAANAGGVAVSGLEMSQNGQGARWPREKVEEELRQIMVSIYAKCEEGSRLVGHDGNLSKGADAIGFLTVARAMEAQGVV